MSWVSTCPAELRIPNPPSPPLLPTTPRKRLPTKYERYFAVLRPLPRRFSSPISAPSSHDCEELDIFSGRDSECSTIPTSAKTSNISFGTRATYTKSPLSQSDRSFIPPISNVAVSEDIEYQDPTEMYATHHDVDIPMVLIGMKALCLEQGVKSNVLSSPVILPPNSTSSLTTEITSSRFTSPPISASTTISTLSVASPATPTNTQIEVDQLPRKQSPNVEQATIIISESPWTQIPTPQSEIKSQDNLNQSVTSLQELESPKYINSTVDIIKDATSSPSKPDCQPKQILGKTKTRHDDPFDTTRGHLPLAPCEHHKLIKRMTNPCRGRELKTEAFTPRLQYRTKYEDLADALRARDARESNFVGKAYYFQELHPATSTKWYNSLYIKATKEHPSVFADILRTFFWRDYVRRIVSTEPQNGSISVSKIERCTPTTDGSTTSMCGIILNVTV